MDSSDAESLEAPRSESDPIGVRLDLEDDHPNRDERGQRGEKSRRGSKKKWVVREDSSFEASAYYL